VSRTLCFNAPESEGEIYLMAEGQPPKQVDAQGDVLVPDGARAFVMLNDAADRDLAFLADADSDVVSGLHAEGISATGVQRLSRQSALAQLAVKGELPDDVVGVLGELRALTALDISLLGEVGPGFVSVSQMSLQSLRLHGDPGASVAAIASMSNLQRLHFHADALAVEHVEPLQKCGTLQHLDIEVTDPSVGSDALGALADLAAILESVSVRTADGESALSVSSQVALLSRKPTLTLNGATYTPAALTRLQRKVPVA
jgi:hypothetical protein